MTESQPTRNHVRSLLVPSAVYVGAVVLIGLPAVVVLFEVFGAALEWVGLGGVIASAWGLVVLGVSLLLGLQLAVEVAAVQLGGIDALSRGSRRMTMARYLLATAVALVAVIAAAWIGFSAATGGYGWPTVALGAAVALAGVVVLYRTIGELWRGIN